MGFRFKDPSYEYYTNMSYPMTKEDINSQIPIGTNYRASSAYRSLDADIRMIPRELRSAGFVTKEYPKTAFITKGAERVPDVIPHEIVHVQQESTPRRYYKDPTWFNQNNKTKNDYYNRTREVELAQGQNELLEKGHFRSRKDKDHFERNSGLPWELHATLQGLEAIAPEGTNIFDTQFKNVSPETRRQLEQYMFPNIPKMFQGQVGDIPPKKKSKTQSMLEELQRIIRNWTAS